MSESIPEEVYDAGVRALLLCPDVPANAHISMATLRRMVGEVADPEAVRAALTAAYNAGVAQAAGAVARLSEAEATRDTNLVLRNAAEAMHRVTERLEKRTSELTAADALVERLQAQLTRTRAQRDAANTKVNETTALTRDVLEVLDEIRQGKWTDVHVRHAQRNVLQARRMLRHAIGYPESAADPVLLKRSHEAATEEDECRTEEDQPQTSPTSIR